MKAAKLIQMLLSIFSCRTDAMDRFLWTVLIYFDTFLVHNEANNDDNLKVPG